MINIIIVSDDICLTNKMINCINNLIKSSSITIYNHSNFKENILTKIKASTTIYLIDIYEIESEFLELTTTIKQKNKSNKIGIININKSLKSLIEAQKNIDFTIEKDCNFYNNLKNELTRILINHTIKNDYNFNKKTITNLTKILTEQEKIQVTNHNFNIILTENVINNIYQFPNNQLSINYKNGNNNILISINNTTPQIQKIIKNKFYIDKENIKNSKRTYYSEPIKQLLVDLHLIFKIDCSTLSKHFQVEAKYIKKWSTLSKYNRKINIPFLILGKLIIKSYLKK